MGRPKKTITVGTVPIMSPDVSYSEKDIVGSMMSLQASSGWAILVKILNENIAYLEKAILEKVDPFSQDKLSDPEIELLRIKRGLNIELRDTPENLTKMIKENGGKAPVDYDPYWKSADAMKKADRLVL